MVTLVYPKSVLTGKHQQATYTYLYTIYYYYQKLMGYGLFDSKELSQEMPLSIDVLNCSDYSCVLLSLVFVLYYLMIYCDEWCSE